MDPMTVLKAVWAFARRYWKEAAMLLLLLIAYLQGGAHRDAVWQAKLSAMKAEAAYNQAKAEADARKQEADWSAAFDVAATISHEELTHVQAHRDRLLSQLRTVRVPVIPAGGGVPEAPADSGQPQAAPESGQPGLAGEELVRRFAQCDEVTLERNQAVRLLEAERSN